MMDTMEKKELYDQVAVMHNDSIISLTNPKMQTRLVIPAIFNQGNTRLGGSSGAAKHCLFNDILGLNKYASRDCFGKSRIINPLDKIYAVKKKRKVKQEQVVSDDDTRVFVPETKTLKLIDKYHKKELKASNKIMASDDNDGPGMYKAGLLRMVMVDFGMKEDKPKFDPKTSILRTVSHVLFIDATYSVSEMVIAFEQMDALFRVSYGNLGYNPYFDIFENYTSGSSRAKSLYGKYEVKGLTVWKRDTESRDNRLNDGSFLSLGYGSLFNEDEMTAKTACNTFIPVTFAIFLENASHLFQPTDSIIREEHTLRNPRFFVSTCAVSGTLGYPDFYVKDEFEGRTRPVDLKTQSKKFTNISMDEYSLKTTLTIIPRDFSTRLIKSKLKSVNQFGVDKSCFHFFSDEDMERLTEKGKNYADNFFCVKFDDRIDLSYYTFVINAWLANKFAGDYYGDYTRVEDFISFGRMVEIPFKETLATSYDELLGRQASLAFKFNTPTHTLISQEMFDYEKANLLYLYLIRKSGLPLYTLRRQQWSDDHATKFSGPLKKNGYIFTREILNSYQSSDISMLRIGSDRKAYLIEAMFRMVRTLPREQLFAEMDRLISESKVKMDAIIKNFISRQTLSKELTTIIKQNPPRDVRDRFDREFLKQRKALHKPNHNMYRLLHDSESLQLIPLLLSDTLLFNYIDNLGSLLRIYCTYLKMFADHTTEGRAIDENGLSVRFLTDSEILKKMRYEYSQYYSNRGNETALLNRLLSDNAKAKVKIEVLEEFTTLLLSEYTKEYLGSTK